ncbi:hypothetical protein THIOM_001682 [Candidatus Thiomargarita nelsonii]|uniref:Uncharacterized protein n=1 Tax=Candidatus Thiomargarita nelsonii TaxID=1003181 RepID=A0A176S331_9GAMM|nr:hypothetical protein THIOM_001682 [Candidatus Thiomargarita nelsonii]
MFGCALCCFILSKPPGISYFFAPMKNGVAVVCCTGIPPFGMNINIYPCLA